MLDETTYVLVNGSFGVGKTTVARELRDELPESIIFDPELIGFFISRMPGYVHSDFQHSKAWRRLTILGAKLAGFRRRIVIIPMTFSRIDYLAEVRNDLEKSDHAVLHFCLIAPIDIVRSRLTGRGESEADPNCTWVHRRAAECCEAHQSEDFATHISTVDVEPKKIAKVLALEICEHIDLN